MEPEVIRMYSSSPPPMEDGAEEEDDEFGDFGTFSSVPNSISFSELDTPTTFNQGQALAATSPPELVGGRGVVGRANGSHGPAHQPSKANGLADRTEDRKVPRLSPDLPAGDCNGGEVLTNGFAIFDLQGSPHTQSPASSHIKGKSGEDAGDGESTQDDFADFAAFSSTEKHTGDEDTDSAAVDIGRDGHHHIEQAANCGDAIRDTNGSAQLSTEAAQRDAAHAASEAVCTKDLNAAVNGADAAQGCNHDEPSPEGDGEPSPERDAELSLEGNGELSPAGDGELSPEGDGEAPCLDGKNSGNDTETETETSLGRPLSTDALEEYGDVSTTGSAPSPPPQEMATPPEHSQLAEDDEDFGEFGDAGSFGGAGFADFEAQPEASEAAGSAPPHTDADFGDFNSPEFEEAEGAEPAQFAEFPVSDSFGNFSSAVETGGSADADWSSFGDQQGDEAGGEEWAAFGSEQSAATTAPSAGDEDEWHESEAATFSEEHSKAEPQTVAPSSRLERLFQCSFPQSSAPPVEEPVASLRTLLEGEGEGPSLGNRRGSVWLQLQDIHEAFGLRHQWGGSYCNKALLCCLGIDTRNILFTGQKKQPVIVPMYAASLGMLEPTKEPVKPVSAAEMIASIAQAPPGAAEKSSCPTVSVQEALPPVQFDWSSSGLTNPLDGVDPELFELTTAKMEPGGSGSRVADAFARLMSTMEKTSTSTRKPRKEENLSEEAAKVISGLPDLTFMQAKVLMFPATLTPLGSQAMAD